MQYIVAPDGHDDQPGTIERPFRTIQKAADLMQPGDGCLIRAGIYREHVRPPRGGVSESERITYAAYPGEMPEIKGSERVRDWTRSTPTPVWTVERPDAFFGDYNPYTLGITGEWLEWTDGLHLGEVYLNGVSLKEVGAVTDVARTPFTWSVEHDADRTIIHAHFGDADPNRELAEILVREQVFFADVQGVNYITVRGLTLMHAANNWAPPESFQRGLIGVNWGSHWVIESCRISDAKCVGISAGKFNPGCPPPPGSRDTVGHHCIRNNWIRRCGEAGIAGNMGFAASRIECNLIEDINIKNEFGGEETAGIKVHNAVDVVIANNLVRRVRDARGKGIGDYPGIWIDWSNQGARLTGNIIYDIDHHALYLEACHGPMLVDNNIIMGRLLRLHAKRVVLAHNLFADSGIIYQDWKADDRAPAWFKPHTRQAAGTGRMRTEGNRFFNNIFIRSDVSPAQEPVDCESAANLYLDSRAPGQEPDSVYVGAPASGITIEDLPNGVRLEIRLPLDPATLATKPVTHARIGRFEAIGQGLEDDCGNPVDVDRDIRNIRRDPAHPTPGPFESVSVPILAVTLTAGPDARAPEPCPAIPALHDHGADSPRTRSGRNESRDNPGPTG